MLSIFQRRADFEIYVIIALQSERPDQPHISGEESHFQGSQLLSKSIEDVQE